MANIGFAFDKSCKSQTSALLYQQSNIFTTFDYDQSYILQYMTGQGGVTNMNSVPYSMEIPPCCYCTNIAFIQRIWILCTVFALTKRLASQLFQSVTSQISKYIVEIWNSYRACLYIFLDVKIKFSFFTWQKLSTAHFVHSVCTGKDGEVIQEEAAPLPEGGY